MIKTLKTFKKILVFFLILFIFILNYENTGVGKKFTNALIIVFVFFEALRISKYGKVKINKDVMAFAYFIIICTISCVFSVNVQDSLIKIKTLIMLLLLLVGLIQYLSYDNNIHSYMKIVAFSGVIAGITLLLNYNWGSGERSDGVIGDSNQVGAYLAYTFSILIYLYKSKQINLIKFIIGSVVIVGAELITGSRSALLVTAIGGLFVYGCSMKNNKEAITKKFLYIIIGVVAVILAFNFIMNNEMMYEIVGKRYLSFFEILSGKKSSINESSTQTRMALINMAWEQFIQTPKTIFIGNGIGFFASYWKSVGGRYAFCHNNYLELLSGTGILGAIPYYYIYFSILIKQLKILKGDMENEKAILLIGILIQMLLMHWFIVFYYQKCEIVFLALLIYFNSEKKVEKKIESNKEEYKININ